LGQDKAPIVTFWPIRRAKITASLFAWSKIQRIIFTFMTVVLELARGRRLRPYRFAYIVF